MAASRAYNAGLSAARRVASVCLACLIVLAHISVGANSVGRLVLCIGPQGHIGVEAARDGLRCTDLSPYSSPGLPYPFSNAEGPGQSQVGPCGPCMDLPLLSVIAAHVVVSGKTPFSLGFVSWVCNGQGAALKTDGSDCPPFHSSKLLMNFSTLASHRTPILLL